MSDSDTPQESSLVRDMFHERTLLDGIFLGVVAYGVHLTLFVWCMNLLVHKKVKSRINWFFMFYISMLFIMGSIGNATNIKLAEVLYVDKRNNPLGFYATGGGPYNVACNVVYIVNSWFQDALLLWRFWMFFGRQSRWYLPILPGLMFLASISFSLVLIVMLCVPGISLRSQVSINLAIPYWAISISLNLGITACIAARLLYMRYQTRQVMESSGVEYISVTSMLVESAALYSTNGLTFLVSYALRSPIQHLALPLLGQTQSIAPLLIVLRVSQGRAWSSTSLTKFENEARLSDIQFAQGRANNTTVLSTDTSPTLWVRNEPSKSSLKAITCNPSTTV